MKIAIIGSGISGLSAAWLAKNKYNVTLFEKQNRFGGHSNTIEVNHHGNIISVDTGFIVYNDKNYPNLVNLFKTLNVPTIKSNMSFSVSIDEGEIEYEGSLIGICAKISNIFDYKIWVMLKGLLSFYINALDKTKTMNNYESLRVFLHKNNFPKEFIYYHLLPMCSSIWSCPEKQMLEYPAQSLINFMENHQLLNFFSRPKWKTVNGGSKIYVQKIINGLKNNALKNINITRVKRYNNNVIIITEKGEKLIFDKVIFACPPHEALKIIETPTKLEKDILEKFNFHKNKIYVHSDQTLMPKKKLAWAAWNYIGNSTSKNSNSLTYWMNKLQNIDDKYPIFVTLNPHKIPKNHSIFQKLNYYHPIFSKDTLISQENLYKIQGKNNSFWCGAWTGNGFHEDGLISSISVLKTLKVSIPWASKIKPYNIN